MLFTDCYFAIIQLSTCLVTSASGWNSNSEHLRIRLNCPTPLNLKFLGESESVLVLSWTVTTPGSYWNCRQTLCKPVKLKITNVEASTLFTAIYVLRLQPGIIMWIYHMLTVKEPTAIHFGVTGVSWPQVVQVIYTTGQLDCTISLSYSMIIICITFRPLMSGGCSDFCDTNSVDPTCKDGIF